MFSMKKLGVLCMAALMAFGAGAAVTANYRVVPLPQKILPQKVLPQKGLPQWVHPGVSTAISF